MKSNDKIAFLDPSNKDWKSFVSNHPEANIFHHPRWIEFLAECYGYEPTIITAKNAEGKIKAGIPLIKVTSYLTGNRWISLPFSDHCMPLFSDNKSLLLLTKKLTQIHKENNLKIELRWEYPQIHTKYFDSKHVLDILPLATNTEEIFYNIQKRTRKYIKAAEKTNLVIKSGNSNSFIRQYYQLQVLTRQRHGIPVQPRKFFDLLGERILENNLGKVLLVYHNDECIAGKVILYWNKTLTFKYSASKTAFWDLNPNHLLSWEAIKWSIENNFRQIDMGRSAKSNEGLRRYKSKWGTKERELIYTTLPGPSNTTKSGRIMKMMNIVIRKSPLFVTKIVGELIYKHFA